MLINVLTRRPDRHGVVRAAYGLFLRAAVAAVKASPVESRPQQRNVLQSYCMWSDHNLEKSSGCDRNGEKAERSKTIGPVRFDFPNPHKAEGQQGEAQ